MSANRIHNIALRTVEKQSIAADDVRDLQVALGEYGFIDRAEAASLLRMELMVSTSCEAWSEFFIETMTGHLIWETRPTGRIRAEDAAWLRRALAGPRFGRAGNVGTLLVNLVREAEEADPALVELALVENHAMTGEVDFAVELRGAA